MGRLIRGMLAVAIAFPCITGSLGAQTRRTDAFDSRMFDDPVTVHFQFVRHYFVQSINNDARYGSIQALIDDDPQQPWYEVILIDKTTGKRTIYCNSQEEVDSLKQEGMDAYYKPIEFIALEAAIVFPTYQIRLRDRNGQEIIWRFVVNTDTAAEETGFVSPPEDSPIVLLFAETWAAGATGTSLTIGDRPELADEPAPPASGGCEAFYASSLIIAEITPGTRLWYAKANPISMR